MSDLSKLNGFRIIIKDLGERGMLDPEDKVTVETLNECGEFSAQPQDTKVSLENFLRRANHSDKTKLLELLTDEESVKKGLVQVISKPWEGFSPLSANILPSWVMRGNQATLPLLKNDSKESPSALDLSAKAEALLRKVQTTQPGTEFYLPGAIEKVSWEMATALDWSALTYLEPARSEVPKRPPVPEMGPVSDDPDVLLTHCGSLGSSVCEWGRYNTLIEGLKSYVDDTGSRAVSLFRISFSFGIFVSGFNRDEYFIRSPRARYLALQEHLALGGTLPPGHLGRKYHQDPSLEEVIQDALGLETSCKAKKSGYID